MTVPTANVVVIHGLGPKPPRARLAERYLRFLRQGVGTRLLKRQFHPVYWANVIEPGRRPLSAARDEFQEGGRNFKSFTRREKAVFRVRGELRELLANEVERRFEKGLAAAERGTFAGKDFLADISANVVDKLARRIYSELVEDLHRYLFGGRGDAVRKTLTDVIDSLPAGSRTCLVAHSMGSIIALDVILRGTRPIDTLVTIGSPLGIKVVQKQIGATRAKRRSIPQRVRRWYNFSDPLDVVALDADLADDFSDARVKDGSIQNEFVSKQGERNHHKSYGYLRNEAVGKPVAAFLNR